MSGVTGRITSFQPSPLSVLLAGVPEAISAHAQGNLPKIISEGDAALYELVLSLTTDDMTTRKTAARTSASSQYLWTAEREVNPQGDATTFTYGPVGHRTRKDLADGSRTSLTYDAAGRLKSVADLKSDDSVVSSFEHECDNVGNRTSVSEANGGRVTWTYDATYQLISEQRSGASAYRQAFVYDSVGNRLVKDEDGTLTTYTYDTANQLQTTEDAGGVTTYTFDANGNQQIVETPDGGRTTYTWDCENQTTLVELPSGAQVTIAYNADNRRVRKEA
jgi:YD repeat-containing protein